MNLCLGATLLPIDIAFGLPVSDKQPLSHSQHVKKLRSHLEESYQVAINNSCKVADKNKKRFDKVIRESTLDVGDRVLAHNLRLRSKHKLGVDNIYSHQTNGRNAYTVYIQ